MSRINRNPLRFHWPASYARSLLVSCAVLGLILALAGCVLPHSLASMNDPEWFKEQPRIVTRDGRYFLRFRYSEQPETHFAFYMMTCSIIEDNKLVFYLSATTSSGNLKGVVQYEEIVSQKKLSLIKKNCAFWIEPDKTLVPLRIEPMTESLDVIPSRVRKH